MEPPGDDRIGGSTVDEKMDATGVDQWGRIMAPGVMEKRKESAARYEGGVMWDIARGGRETAAEQRMGRIAALGHRRVTPAEHVIMKLGTSLHGVWKHQETMLERVRRGVRKHGSGIPVTDVVTTAAQAVSESFTFFFGFAATAVR